jgi:NAD(P)H-dependent FMN reductase
MLKVAIIVGSTRQGRRALDVANWTLGLAKARGDAVYEVVDINDFDLPVLDEPVPPSMRKYSKDHTKRWSAVVASYDAYVFVTPEYNHSISGALKNAIDFVYHEWTNKAAGFVSYGTTGGVRAVEHLRGICAEIQIADVRGHVSLSLYTDFEKFTTFRPGPGHEPQLGVMLGQLVTWSKALKTVREEQATKAAA